MVNTVVYEVYHSTFFHHGIHGMYHCIYDMYRGIFDMYCGIYHGTVVYTMVHTVYTMVEKSTMVHTVNAQWIYNGAKKYHGNNGNNLVTIVKSWYICGIYHGTQFFFCWGR
jgi:hypothetical protein